MRFKILKLVVRKVYSKHHTLRIMRSFSYTVFIYFKHQNNIYKKIKHLTIITVDMKGFNSDVTDFDDQSLT